MFKGVSQMQIHTLVRIHVESPLTSNIMLTVTNQQFHYLNHVMRLRKGDYIRLFNGMDGEWLAVIRETERKRCHVEVIEQICKQPREIDVWLAFSPIKANQMSLVVEKGTELGISTFIPILTKLSVVRKVNMERLRAQALEAAEQSERFSVPEIMDPMTLEEFQKQWQSNPDFESRNLLLCDETGTGAPIYEKLQMLSNSERYCLMIGPEGGFTKSEIEETSALSRVIPLSLGPRILRAETAALVAITCFQSTLGDWKQGPRGRRYE